jgi:Uncharacterised nucleotidyltransferase
VSGLSGSPELIQTLAADRTTANVIRAFAARQINPILLKGPSMAGWLYPEGGRRYVDCDLLVSPRDQAAAQDVLRGLGFEAALARARRAERETHSMPWEKAGHAVGVDLHHTLAGATQSDETVWRTLSANTESFELGALTCRVLSAEARALHVALHAAEDGLVNLQVKEDLTRALQVVTPAQWEKAASLAAQIGATQSFSAGLRLLPEGAVVAARLRLPDRFSAQVSLRAAGHPATAVGMAQVFAAGSLRQSVAMVVSKVFPTPTFMRRWYPQARRPWGLPPAYLRRWIWIIRNAPAGYRAWRGNRGNPK